MGRGTPKVETEEGAHRKHRGNYDKLTIKNMGLNLCENSNKASKTKCEKSCLKVAYNK